MKYFTFIVCLLLATLSYGQDNFSLSGNVFDLESNNTPLVYAKVSIKENGLEVLSDEQGAFKFENLAKGTYTLIYSFVGYQTEETTTTVISKNNNVVKLYLGASTISLDDLMTTLDSADKKESAAK
ncbi:carboxypeptidase-like regulatory domain-containing protein [uncultured Algibacter sp.]|uniref:carboxypeptidase-like regulatory domain-containing protein n=1 Tax=uncultured Algibacter sp. TaxID=298659 RepID=UPI00321767BC